ncbi:MAG: hypothetical protein M0000_11165, partial [Actinomycetota bacterium]|nr:hypothetical protein [Actinomycetota bacterium]
GHDRLASDTSRPIQLLSNASEKCNATLLTPDPGEESHLCAGRLTPSAYPFEVRTIRYHLGHGASQSVECNAGLEHKVELYVSSGVKPPASPTSPLTLTVPAMDPKSITSEGREVSLDLASPLTLATGEHLFIAIRFAGTHPNVLCVGVNEEDPYQSDRNYWSNAAAAPYPWVQLDSFGLKGSIMVSALGYFK